jgi:DNA repair protein RadA/Sms
MPRLGEISGEETERISLGTLPWLTDALGGGIVPGGIYLLAGEPGIGKSTLALQVLGAAAEEGLNGLYVATEQSLADVKGAAVRILGDGRKLPATAQEHVWVDTTVDDLEDLPKFLTRRVMPPGQDYFGTKVLVLDSIQGRGVSAASTRKYNALYDFNDQAKATGIVVFLVGHVTKGGQIAGPKDLEHNVDCVMYMRRAFRLRPFFVPKNRYGPAVIDPVVLEMDRKGRLSKAPHQEGITTTALGYGGVGGELAEAQAVVTLPTYGSRPQLNAPFLPSKRVKQIVAILAGLKDIDLSDLSYEINCYLPAKQQYRAEMDLPIAVALLASYLKRPIPAETLFVGELDLQARVRRPDERYLAALAEVLIEQPTPVRRVICSPEAAEFLRGFVLKEGGHVRHIPSSVQLVSCVDLPQVISGIWPKLEGDEERHAAALG